jgi:nucleoside-diphosphate-sugar epimerase
MTQTLVVGASGATGRLVVSELLERGHHVRVVVRSIERLPENMRNDPRLSVTEASLLNLSDADLRRLVDGCDAVVSCLGHVISFKGMYGPPRDLCTQAARRLCKALENTKPPTKAKFILMSSAGVRNPSTDPPRTAFDRALLFALRHLVPPHRDNETAAEHLLQVVGTGTPGVEWCAVRPDTLENAAASDYVLEQAPVTPILKGRPTARANVAQFMVALIEDDALWQTWKFRTPVLMNNV